MAYNENLADKIRQSLAHLTDIQEKKMFGNLAFMVDGKMCLTAGADRMMCRIDPALHEEVVGKTRCRPVIMKGRRYKGYVYVDNKNLQEKADFNYWIKLALDFNKKAKASVKKHSTR